MITGDFEEIDFVHGGHYGALLPFDGLRSRLVALPETGDAGFEGLIAAACSQIAGVPFRLIGSGRQFGREAEGTVADAAILFEAKRYNTRLSFADLSVKLNEALKRSRR